MIGRSLRPYRVNSHSFVGARFSSMSAYGTKRTLQRFDCDVRY